MIISNNCWTFSCDRCSRKQNFYLEFIRACNKSYSYHVGIFTGRSTMLVFLDNLWTIYLPRLNGNIQSYNTHVLILCSMMVVNFGANILNFRSLSRSPWLITQYRWDLNAISLYILILASKTSRYTVRIIPGIIKKSWCSDIYN